MDEGTKTFVEICRWLDETDRLLKEREAKLEASSEAAWARARDGIRQLVREHPAVARNFLKGGRYLIDVDPTVKQMFIKMLREELRRPTS